MASARACRSRRGVLLGHPLPRHLEASPAPTTTPISECPSAAITLIVRSQLGGAAPPSGLSAAGPAQHGD
ncbi:hypothetical protein ON010_g17285 [Phytophthora cinnamomi]|nr:hypothetical protein ON010_g17285 [Phytophthora cinnamomi]